MKISKEILEELGFHTVEEEKNFLLWEWNGILRLKEVKCLNQKQYLPYFKSKIPVWRQALSDSKENEENVFWEEYHRCTYSPLELISTKKNLLQIMCSCTGQSEFLSNLEREAFFQFLSGKKREWRNHG